MKLSDYLSREKFPLTSRPALSAREQLMLDAFNNNQLAELVEEGKPLTAEQKARWAEYQEKAKAFKEVSRQVTELELAEKRQKAEEKDRIYRQAAAMVEADRQEQPAREPRTPEDEALRRAD